jgi:hypothetical protein
MRRLAVAAVKFVLVALFVFPMSARAQFFFVDCSGANPSAYPSINAALPFAGPGTFIAVVGTCNENVALYGFNNFTLGAFFGQGVTLNGNLSINNSQNVYVYGVNVTNGFGDGIDVTSSRSVVLDTCTSSGNAGNGLTASQSSDVSINAMGGFSNNGSDGIFVGNNSLVNVVSWAGTTEISNNRNAALGIYSGNFSTNGNTHMANSGSFAAIDMRGAGKAQIGSFFGSNVIENNPFGAASLQENAEISLWSLPQFSGPNIVRNNGPFGIEAGFGSQVTLAGAQITGHSGPGVDIYAHSQLYGSQLAGLGTSQIQNNGTFGDPLSAAVRVDGNSEVLLRGIEISGNHGPAILALANSSADFAGVTFNGNTGVITCDSSSTMVSDLAIAGRTPAAGVSCTSPYTRGNRAVRVPAPPVPDTTTWKKMHSDYQQRSATRK